MSRPIVMTTLNWTVSGIRAVHFRDLLVDVLFGLCVHALHFVDVGLPELRVRFGNDVEEVESTPTAHRRVRA